MMATGLGAMALVTALGIGPFGHGGMGCPTCGPSGYYSAAPSAGYVYPAAPGYAAAGVPSAGGFMTGTPAVAGPYGAGSSMGQLNPYDSPSPWMHGYIQHLPVYGGFRYFRPYNYKHVLSQSTTAGQWGMSPTMPYSQQFWHRYQDKASLTPPGSSGAQTTFATEYARELSRLKAWRDFQASQAAGPGLQNAAVSPAPSAPMPASAEYGAAAAYGPPPAATSPPSPGWPVPHPMAGFGAPASAPAGPGAMVLPPPPSRLSPAGAVAGGVQIEQLQRQVQEQARQIQALQNVLNQQAAPSRSWGDVSTWNGPSRWNPAPRGY
ncbi:MAG: hypothetical protein GXP27_21570 [Planctomycetes bacterium]|nr:hypothetical protein [Planctomycetota bacterium]